MLNIHKNLNTKLKSISISKPKKKSGFTLIELIVVIAIIAILAAALTPTFTGYVQESRKVSVINQAKSVVTAYEAINAKTTSTIPKSQTIDSFIASQTVTLLNADELKNIETSIITIDDCFNALNSDGYTFDLDDDNILVTHPTTISTTTSTTTTP